MIFGVDAARAFLGAFTFLVASCVGAPMLGLAILFLYLVKDGKIPRYGRLSIKMFNQSDHTAWIWRRERPLVYWWNLVIVVGFGGAIGGVLLYLAAKIVGIMLSW
jgi:hypothetical protein